MKYALLFITLSLLLDYSVYIVAGKADIDTLCKKIVKVHEDGAIQYGIKNGEGGLVSVIIRPNGTQEQYFNDRIEYYYPNNTVGYSFIH